MSDTPMFSKPPNPERTFVEVRPLLPTEDVAVLDAVCQAEAFKRRTNVSRTELLKEIVHEWAEEQRHRATLVLRVSGGNPQPSESLEG